MSKAEVDQARIVNAAYWKTGTVNPEYEREFETLADMRRANMADKFRDARGLPPNAKTPYDNTPIVTTR